MRTLAIILLSLIPLVAVGSLSVLFTMREAKVPTVRLLLMLEVWGLCLLFGIPFGFIVAAIGDHG